MIFGLIICELARCGGLWAYPWPLLRPRQMPKPNKKLSKGCSTAQRPQHFCAASIDRIFIYPLPQKMPPESSCLLLLRREKGNRGSCIAGPAPKPKRLPPRCAKRGILPAIITAGWRPICGATLKPGLPPRTV